MDSIKSSVVRTTGEKGTNEYCTQCLMHKAYCGCVQYACLGCEELFTRDNLCRDHECEDCNCR